MIKKIISFLFIVTITIFFSCVVNPVTGVKQISFMSEAQEVALGKDADPQIQAMYGVYDDQKLQNFINEKGQAMASISHRPDLKFTFRVLDSDVVNAFALPGGFVYFTRGILAHFNNEAEFAGVLGHEIGHVTARHGARQQTSQILTQIGLVAGIVLSPQLAENAESAMQAVKLMNLSFSRDHESESDALGVEYSSEIGYDASYMANFFKTLKRLSDNSGQQLPTFLSTHPDPVDRYSDVSKMSAKYQQKHPNQKFVTNREAYLRMIDGIIYGKDPNQGYIENNEFVHPQLRFNFKIPSGFSVNNQPSQVQLYPKDQTGIIIFTLAKGNNLQEVANKLIQNQGLTVGKSEESQINGMPAYVFEATAQQKDGKTFAISTFFIKYGEYIYQFQGITTPDKFESYKPIFSQCAKSFDKEILTSKLNVKPERINVKKVPNSMSLKQFLISENIPSKRLEEIAILNSMNLEDNLNSGTLVKLISK